MAFIPGTSAGGDLWQFDYKDMQRKLMRMVSIKNIRLAREVVKKTLNDAAKEQIKIAKDIVANEVSDSGRLAAGLGYYEPGYLHKGAKGKGSSPDDAFWQSSTKGNIYTIEYGTNVPYAAAIMLGFTVEESRVIYLPAEGRFITIQPFTFSGIHALERAEVEFAASGRLNKIFEDNMKVLAANWR